MRRGALGEGAAVEIAGKYKNKKNHEADECKSDERERR